MEENFVLQVSEKYKSPLVKVYDTWISPEIVVDPVQSISFKPEVGEQIHFIMKTRNGEVPVSGTFQALEQNNRLMFSLEWGDHKEFTNVTVRFKDLEDNETKVTINHIGFDEKSSCDMFEQFWKSYLVGFREYLT